MAVIVADKVGYYGISSGGTSDVRVGTVFNNSTKKLVTRYHFKTDSSGATKISFQTYGGATGCKHLEGDPDSVALIRFTVTYKEDTYINYQGNKGHQLTAGTGYVVSDSGGYIKGSMTINLLPNTDCYLWIFPGTQMNGSFGLGNCRVTTSGVYGPSSVTASDGFFGDDIPIIINPVVSGVTHTITVECADRTDPIASNTSETSLMWTPDQAVYAGEITDANSAQATIVCVTHIGSTDYTTTKTITVSFKDTVLNPVLSSGWATLKADNDAAISADGKRLTIYVQSISKVLVEFDNAKIAVSGTSISQYSITINGQTISGAGSLTALTSVTLDGAGTVDVVVAVIDARGHSASETFQITVYEYYKPRILDWSIYRSDANGARASADSYVSGTALLGYPLLNNENVVKIYLAAVETNQSFDTDGVEMTPGSITTIPNKAPSKSYTGRIRAIDIIGNITDVTDLVPPAIWALRITKSGNQIIGAGIGMAPSTSKVLELPSDWNIKVGSDYLFYNAGDSINGTFAVFGWITTGAADVVLHVKLPRIIKSGLTFTATTLTCSVRKADGGYVSGANANLLSSISACAVTQNGLRITLNGSSWGTNNTPVAGDIVLAGDFS